MKQARVGFLGMGFIGKVHAYGYVNLSMFYDPMPLEARITRICTGHKDSARKAAAVYGAEAVTDYRRITEDPEIDIVHICTPNHLHKDALLSAMAHGKHIYCDKPLTATWDEAREIEAALPQYRGTAQMTLQCRFFPATMRARQLVEAGFLGQVLEFRAAYLHAGSADPTAPLKWKLSGAAGGGVVADLGPHVMDLVHWLLGDYEALTVTTSIAYPTRPSAADPSQRVPVDAEDSFKSLVRLRGGATGTIEATKLSTGAEDELRVEVHGSHGAIRFNSMDPHHLEVYDATVSDRPQGGMRGWTRVDCGQRFPSPASGFPGPKFTMGWVRAHMACLANFLQAVAEGRPGEPGLRQGVYLQRLIEVTRQSAAGGQWIKVRET